MISGFKDGKIYGNGIIAYKAPVGGGATTASNNTNIIKNLISGKTPWGIYDASLWNSTTNTLPEATGNGRDAVLSGGTISMGTSSGNGSGTGINIPYITGLTTSKLLWPLGSIPTNFTICTVTRYVGTTTCGRIIVSKVGNWLHGHWNRTTGVAIYSGGYGATGVPSSDVIKTSVVQAGVLSNNWLVFCGNNGSYSAGVTTTPTNILADSVGVGTAYGGYGGNNFRLSINDNPGYSELSDWAFTYAVIYDTVLTDAEMLTVSNKLKYYLANGTMSTIAPSTAA